jgi:hypothetical protein
MLKVKNKKCKEKKLYFVWARSGPASMCESRIRHHAVLWIWNDIVQITVPDADLALLENLYIFAIFSSK